MASITIKAEGEEAQKFTLEAASVTLGRGLESDIRLKDIKSSRRHCQITRTPQGYEVVDLSSGNGTLVNGAPIKQHRLKAGDRIQIGTTTITFADGDSKGATSRAPAGQTARTPAAAKPAGAAPPAKTAAAAPAAAKKSTGPTPVASRPAGSTTRSGVPKPTTAKVPVSPTKKITTGVPPAKPPTQSLNRPSTTSLKKGTQRAGHTTRSTGFVSATQRFQAEARKKKMNPVAIIIGLIAVVFLVVIGFIFFGGGEDTKLVKAQLDQANKRAAAFYDENRFDEAIAEYERALKIAEKSDTFKGQAASIRAIIREVQQQRDLMAEATLEFQAFKKKFDNDEGTARQLWDEGKQLQVKYGSSDVPWIKDLKNMLERLGKMIDTDRAIEKRMDFQVRRNEINDQCQLGDKSGKAQWSTATRRWREYLDSKPSDDNRNKAENEIRRIGRLAYEEVDSLRRRALRMVEEKKNAEAVDMLKQQRPRFEKTEGEEVLEKLIKEIGEK